MPRQHPVEEYQLEPKSKHHWKPQQPKTSRRKKKKEMKKLYLILVPAILLLLILVGAQVLFTNFTPKEKEPNPITLSPKEWELYNQVSSGSLHLTTISLPKILEKPKTLPPILAYAAAPKAKDASEAAFLQTWANLRILIDKNSVASPEEVKATALNFTPYPESYQIRAYPPTDQTNETALEIIRSTAEATRQALNEEPQYPQNWILPEDTNAEFTTYKPTQEEVNTILKNTLASARKLYPDFNVYEKFQKISGIQLYDYSTIEALLSKDKEKQLEAVREVWTNAQNYHPTNLITLAYVLDKLNKPKESKFWLAAGLARSTTQESTQQDPLPSNLKPLQRWADNHRFQLNSTIQDNAETWNKKFPPYDGEDLPTLFPIY